MKDYSLNLEERKDFILGYEITSDGMIKIRFAKGKPWIIPYNSENEKKLLDKMEKQLEKSSVVEEKIKDKFLKSVIASGILFGFALIPIVRMFGGENFIFLLSASSVLVGASLIPGIIAIKNKIKLNDLRKNVRFLEMEEKLNESVRTDQNTLVNVSSKTKNVVKDFPEDKPVFNINSFNYVPFSDLEQIMENAARNERFGFDYSKQEEPAKGIVRKKTR